jgi:2'-5' RNA ligase
VHGGAEPWYFEGSEHPAEEERIRTMPRLFVAVDLPERIKDDITATYIALPGARWIDEPNLHLTLRFIGDVPGDKADGIRAALRMVKGPAFSLRASGVGWFPPRRDPRILWVGLAACEELLRLQARVERTLSMLGHEGDGRKFNAHITVARLDATHPSKVAPWVAQNSLFATEPFPVSSFHLYWSFTRREGAIHEKLASYPLESGDS